MTKPRVARIGLRWTVTFKPTDIDVRNALLCDSWEHALRVANRIARRQHREN